MNESTALPLVNTIQSKLAGLERTPDRAPS